VIFGVWNVTSFYRLGLHKRGSRKLPDGSTAVVGLGFLFVEASRKGHIKARHTGYDSS